MKGYKGFEKGLICKGKQYAENTVYEEAESIICEKGMHFCENPFDVLSYYTLVNDDGAFNEYAEVEALGDTKTDDGKKFCTTKLRIGAKLSFGAFIDICVDYLVKKTKPKAMADNSSGNGARIGSSGYGAQIGSSGNGARINSEGEQSVVCCAGNNSVVKAKVGSWITLSEWKNEDSGKWVPVCVKTEQVDGERIKADTFYKLVHGEFVEVKNG